MYDLFKKAKARNHYLRHLLLPYGRLDNTFWDREHNFQLPACTHKPHKESFTVNTL